jgi:hypothetical protein
MVSFWDSSAHDTNRLPCPKPSHAFASSSETKRRQNIIQKRSEGERDNK